MAKSRKLPMDLIESIFERLTFFPDMVRFGAVCRSWRSVFVKSQHHASLQFPLVFIPGDGKLLTLNDSKISKLMLNKITEEERRIVGAFEGWLILINKHLDCYVLNPFSSDFKIELPSLTTLPDIEDVRCTQSGTIEFLMTTPVPDSIVSDDLFEYFIDKIVLSSNPATSPDFMAMCIIGVNGRLAFYKSGDLKWTPVESNWSYADITYHQGRFYALADSCDVVICDMGTSALISVIALPSLERDILISKKYLVDCDGELLLVARKLDIKEYSAPYITIGFNIFKLDTSATLWSPVNSLGNQILFLGINSSLSVSSNDSRFSGCKANHIYFTDDDRENSYQQPWGGHDLGLFNLEDKTLKPHFQSDNQRIWPSPIWITHKPSQKIVNN